MTHLRPLALACLSLLPVLQASAYLGGFEQADGYIFGLNYVVTQYNAGQFGLNAGYPGGAYSGIPTGTGLWQKLSGYEYPTPSPATSNFSYAIAHTGYDRATHGTPEGSNLQAMVITTNSNGWNGESLKYQYNLDSQDLGGITPLATGSSLIQMSFWWCAEVYGTGTNISGVQGGLGPGSLADIIEFKDSAGNVGFKLGLLQPDTTTDYVVTDVGNGWENSGIAAYTTGYSRWDLTFDLAAQTISVGYLDGASMLYSQLHNNVALAQQMSDLSVLTFETSPGVFNAKLMSLDDFSFNVTAVPEPSSLMLGAVAGLLLATPRRRPVAAARA